MPQSPPRPVSLDPSQCKTPSLTFRFLETTLSQNFSLPQPDVAPEQQAKPGLSDAASAVRKAYANGIPASINTENSKLESPLAEPSPLDQSEQDRLYALHLQQQWDADAALAARLAGEDDDDDEAMFTPETEDEGIFTAEMLAEQQNLWAAFAAQAEDQDEQEAFARRLQEQIEAEEEQEELARRIQDELERQEREDREYAEFLMEEQRREDEEALEEVRKIAEELERKERMAECVVCSEEFEKEDLLMLPCEHAYCEDCLRRITPIPK
jgi:signal transduction histidine kinase